MIAKIAAAFGDAGRSKRRPSHGTGAREGSPTWKAPGPTPSSDPGLVGVYDPHYAKALRTTDHGDRNDVSADSLPGVHEKQELPLNVAWRRARLRAEGGLIRRQVPAEYRGIVRRFFEMEGR